MNIDYLTEIDQINHLLNFEGNSELSCIDNTQKEIKPSRIEAI
jgi:hypothetical protein